MRTNISRRSRSVGILLAGALVLAGCADSSDSSDNGGSGGSSEKEEIYVTGNRANADSPGDPVQGGTLTVAEYGEARSLNPTETYAEGTTGGSALAAVYDTLMRYDYEEKEWAPRLAESLESDDKTTWTLKLRDGVEFSDGTPLNADAVLGSLGYYSKNYGYRSLLMMSNMKSMSAVDDLTVEFELTGPWGSFPAMLAGGPGMIMAPAAYKDPKNFKPIGAGAFELESYSPGEELVFTAREDYWDGAPYLDKLRMVYLGADDAKMESVASGAVDAAYLRNQLAVQKAREDGYGGMMYVLGNGNLILINNREGYPGSDVRVRQAMAHAFDNEAYVDRALEGAGLVGKSIFADTSPWSTGVETPAIDRDEATQLLDEAKADGYDGKITYLASADPQSQAGAVQIEAQLEAVGFDVTTESSDSIADIVKRVFVDHDFDLSTSATSIDDADPYSALYESLFSKSPTNGSGYNNPDMDAALAALQPVSDDPEDGAEAMKALEEVYQETIPSINIAPGAFFLPHSDKVHGIEYNASSLSYYAKAWKEQ